jgi:hypothetical protein
MNSRRLLVLPLLEFKTKLPTDGGFLESEVVGASYLPDNFNDPTDVLRIFCRPINSNFSDLLCECRIDLADVNAQELFIEHFDFKDFRFKNLVGQIVMIDTLNREVSNNKSILYYAPENSFYTYFATGIMGFLPYFNQDGDLIRENFMKLQGSLV